jgi:SAM-dependent methyltransferase
MEPPRLFDLDLLARRRARAGRERRADFLHEAMARELSERVTEVNRTFRAPAVVGPRAEIYARALAEAGLPAALCVADDEILALEPAAHDLVVHGLALHWANDPIGQLAQARRALRPDGLLLAGCLGGATLSELRAALAEAEAEVAGGLSPRVAPMGGVRDLGGLLQRAGLALPVADGWRLEVRYESLFHLMRDLRAMGETNALRDRLRRPTRRAVFERAAALYAERFAAGDGRVRATFEMIVLTGWAPDPSQQKPLRPGSASARLADALGAAERSAGVKAGGG